MVLWLLALAVIGALAWIRLAPSDPARWHLDRYNAAAESQDPLAVSIMDMLRAGES